ncbi:MAG TPA: AGE family epimerase/isomerase [Chthonomonadales bacterium]|nr:AGE family epimerase/isomerase [Chthonomonadales bacterium]
MSAQSVDLGWFGPHMLQEVLPRWIEEAVTPSGIFHTTLDRGWRRTGDGSGTLVSQARVVHNFAAGWRLTGEERYRDAVRLGARALAERFRDREEGGFFWSCDAEGRPVDTRKDSYGHAFALFGLAHALGVEREPAIADAAEEARSTLRDRLTDDHGGLVLLLDRRFGGAPERRSQNPMMHAFEALLAAAERGGLEGALVEAERVGRFVLSLPRGPAGALFEFYDRDWNPLPAAEGGRIDVGHQFEWAWLLSEGVRLGLPAAWLGEAQRLLDVGLRHGIDPDGGVRFALDPELLPTSHGLGWWEQCEGIRALLRFAGEHGRADAAPRLARLTALARERFVDPEHGGWFMRVEPDGQVPDTSKGTHWKVDYHVVGMCVEGVRQAERASAA